MKKYKLVFLLCLFAGCSQAESCVQYIDCADGMQECQSHALEICPRGYQELNDADVGADFSRFAQSHFSGAASGVPHMVVRCD